MNATDVKLSMNELRTGINSLSDQRTCWRPPCFSVFCPSTFTSSILYPLGLLTSSHPCLESRASFLGNRYFVLKTGEATLAQAMKFGGLYGVIAVFHGLVLLTGPTGMPWITGLVFLIAIVVQVSLSYLGNKLLVLGNETHSSNPSERVVFRCVDRDLRYSRYPFSS